MRKQSVTIKDVASLAGVSTATVSRVINQDPKVSKAASISVKGAMLELGYRVNPIARSLRSSITHTIGILSPEFRNDFFMAVAEGIEGELRSEGYTAFILNSRENIEEEQARIELLVEKQVDGAIIIPASSRGDHYQVLFEEGIPFVLVDRIIEGMKVDAVLTDNIGGAFQAVELAIRDGARRIAFIGGNPSLTSARERFIGYERSLRMNSISLDEAIITYGDMHFESGYQCMGDILQEDPDIRFVFVANLFMRMGAERYLADHHNSRNLRFIAFDDSPVSSIFAHDYITVCQPMELIGSTAAQLLVKRIRSQDSSDPKVFRLKPDIRVRRNRQFS